MQARGDHFFYKAFGELILASQRIRPGYGGFDSSRVDGRLPAQPRQNQRGKPNELVGWKLPGKDFLL